MQPSFDPIEQPEEPMKQAEGIDLVAAYRTVLRALARLESGEYTSDNERQADVWGHDDLPDPASEKRHSAGLSCILPCAPCFCATTCQNRAFLLDIREKRISDMRTYKRPEPPPQDPYQNPTAAGRSACGSLLPPVIRGTGRQYLNHAANGEYGRSPGTAWLDARANRHDRHGCWFQRPIEDQRTSWYVTSVRHD